MDVADTFVIIWEALAPQKLSINARREFSRWNQSHGIVFCDISLWEIAMLIAKKRLILEVSFPEFIDLLTSTRNYIFQPITSEIAHVATNLSLGSNADPADHIIAATSLVFNSSLITADNSMRQSQRLQTIW